MGGHVFSHLPPLAPPVRFATCDNYIVFRTVSPSIVLRGRRAGQPLGSFHRRDPVLAHRQPLQHVADSDFLFLPTPVPLCTLQWYPILRVLPLLHKSGDHSGWYFKGSHGMYRLTKIKTRLEAGIWCVYLPCRKK